VNFDLTGLCLPVIIEVHT